MKNRASVFGLISRTLTVLVLTMTVTLPVASAAGDTFQVAQTSSTAQVEKVFWESVKDSKDPAFFQEYLKQYPNGIFAGLARLKIKQLSPPGKPSAETAPVPAPAATKKTDEEEPKTAIPVNREDIAPAAKPPLEGARVVLVLDASGSMWGQIKGKTKIEIAREVIADLMGTIQPGIEMGLSAYGHRRKGDCTDIEMLLPVSPVDPSRVVQSVNALNPKGKTPLSEAVRQAAVALAYTEERAEVILVSDGKETCGADPCAVGRSLEETGVDFTAHVIGFDVPQKDQEGLKCLAESTGGRFLMAGDAASLSATLGAVVKEVAERAPFNVQVTVIPKAGGKPYPGGIDGALKAIEVFPLGDDGAVAGKFVGRGDYVNPGKFTLPAGRYRAVATVGSGGAGQADFEVKADETVELDLIAGVGHVVITSIPRPGGKPYPGSIGGAHKGAVIYPIGADGKVARNMIDGANYSNPATFSLPPGRYRAVSKVGKSVGEADFEVVTDETVEVTVVVGVGDATITVIPKAGAKPYSGGISGALKGVAVYPIGADGKVPGIYIDRSHYSNPATFTLPPGRYRAVALIGDEDDKVDFEVKVDEAIEITIVAEDKG